MTDLEFTNKVLAYKGKYSEKELRKFIKYYVERKHFSNFEKFSIGRRLATWFSQSRKEKFEEKVKDTSPETIQRQMFMNSLGKFNPLK